MNVTASIGLRLLVLFCLLFSIVPPATALTSRSAAVPKAPSEELWAGEEHRSRPVSDPAFVDPIELALRQALGSDFDLAELGFDDNDAGPSFIPSLDLERPHVDLSDPASFLFDQEAVAPRAGSPKSATQSLTAPAHGSHQSSKPLAPLTTMNTPPSASRSFSELFKVVDTWFHAAVAAKPAVTATPINAANTSEASLADRSHGLRVGESSPASQAPQAALTAGYVRLLMTEQTEDGALVVYGLTGGVGDIVLHVKDFTTGLTYVEEPNPDDSLFYLEIDAPGHRLGLHFENSSGDVLPYEGFDLPGQYAYRLDGVDTFQMPFVGQKAPSWALLRTFIEAYEASGGVDRLGPADKELVHDWGGYLVQGFKGGNGNPGSVMVYNPKRCTAIVVAGKTLDAYMEVGGPGGELGPPIYAEMSSQGDPRFIYYTGRDLQLFEHGLIGEVSGGSYSATAYPPLVGELSITLTETEPGLAEASFSARAIPYHDNRALDGPVSVSVQYYIEDTLVGHTELEETSNNIFVGTASELFPLSTTLELQAFVTRPSDGKLSRLFIQKPWEQTQSFWLDLADLVATTYELIGTFLGDPTIVNCSSGPGGIPGGDDPDGPPRDTEPPEIRYIKIFTDGMGAAYVSTEVTDNYGPDAIKAVSLLFNGKKLAMEHIEGNIYGVVVDNVPPGLSSYRIHAVDGAGNEAYFPSDAPILVAAGQGGLFGSELYSCQPCKQGYLGAIGDPVNTFNGNFTYQTIDATVAGIGDTELELERAYNSLAALSIGGGIVQYTNNGSGQVAAEEVTGPPQYFGRAWTFPYATRLIVVDNPLLSGAQVFYPDGRVVNFASNGDGTFSPTTPFNHDLLTATGSGYALRSKQTLEVDVFDSTGRLIGRRDRNGNKITLTYAGERLTRAENDSGRWLTFEYTDDGFIKTIRGPENKVLQYEYKDGNLVAYVDGNGKTTRYTYSDKGQLTQITTPKSHPSMRLVYDDQGRVANQIIGATEAYTLSYSADNTLTIQTDALARTTKHYYKDGKLVQSENALGVSEYYGYDDDYNRNYFKDRNGREYHYTFDDQGNKLTEDGPLSWHREWKYNDLNRVKYMKDAEGRETLFAYDPRGNLTSITNARSDSNRIIYDDRGLPTNVFDFNDNETVNTYDPATGDLVKTVNGEGDPIEYTYDGLGRRHTLKNGRAFVYTYTYDGNDNLTDVDGPLGYHRGYRFDDNNNLFQEIDPRDGVIEYVYNTSERVVEVKNQLLHSTFYGYDLMGNLTRLEDAEGRIWSYRYDAANRRTEEHGPEDTHAFFGYDGVGTMTSETHCNSVLVNGTCALKQVTLYKHNELDQLVVKTENAVEGALPTVDVNVTTVYTHSLMGNLKELRDAKGNTTFYEHDELNRLKRTEDAEQQVTQYKYDDMSNLNLLTNPRGFSTGFTYDKANRLETTTNADTKTWLRDYDTNGNLLFVKDPNGVVTFYGYDALDRRSSVTQNYVPTATATSDRNVKTTYEYDLAGNLRFVHNPRGSYITEHEYDAAQQRIKTIDAEDGETEYGYDRVGNLTSVTDQNDHVSEYTYDGLNRLTQATNAEAHAVAYTYDRLGNMLTETDARLHTWLHTYDGMSRRVKTVDPLQGVWTIEYDAMGNIQWKTDANTHSETFTYDRVYRLLSHTDAEQHTTSFTYDKNGNRLTVTDGNTHVSTSTYDVLDRLETATNGEGETTTYHYDALGNPTQQIDPDQVVTLYGYDPLYRLSAVTLNYRAAAGETADMNLDTSYGYDEAGNLISILDAEEHQTSFSYDGLNRLVKEIDAEDHVWEYDYDPASNRTLRIDANGHRTTYDYYPDNQLKHISYDDGTSVAYSYDENNNRLTMVDHLGTSSWAYDALNRKTDYTDAFGRHLGYDYDPVGNRLSLTYPDGRVQHATYYDNNWLKSVVNPGGLVTSYERDGVGLTTVISNPNSTRSDLAYDKANRLLTIVNKQLGGAAKVNSAFSYVYDDVGQRVEMRATYGWRNPATMTSTYTYDPIRRLVRDGDSEGRWTAYGFDRVGNRTELRTNDDSRTPRRFDALTQRSSYSPTNRLLSVTDIGGGNGPNAVQTTTFKYDANGNRVQKLFPGPQGPQIQGVDYTYDRENRLVRHQEFQNSRVDRALTTLEYDGDGRRLSKTYDPTAGSGGAKRTEYAFDGLDAIVEYQLWNDHRASYYRGDQSRIVSMQHFPAGGISQMFWYHYDGLGSVAGLTKQKGQSHHNYRYEPYGQIEMPPGNFTAPHQSFTFTGQELDEETGLYHFFARDYDAQTGTWIQQDSYRGELRDPRSLHRMAYVHGSPVNYRDERGYYVESALDVASISYDVYDITQNGLNWENGLSLVADVGGLLLPFATGGGLLVRGVMHADDAIDIAKNADNVIDISKVKNADDLSEFSKADKLGGIKPYKELMADPNRKGLDVEIHHLFEQRFKAQLGVKDTDDMLSIALTKDEHRKITNLWRKEIGYKNSKNPLNTATASKEEILEAARRVYKDNPGILKKLDLLDDKGNLVEDADRLKLVLFQLGVITNKTMPAECLSLPEVLTFTPLPQPVPTPSPLPRP